MSNEVEAQVGAGFEAMAPGSWTAARDSFTAALEIEELPEAPSDSPTRRGARRRHR